MFDVLEPRVLELRPMSVIINDAGIAGDDYIPTGGGVTPTEGYHILDEFGNYITDEFGNRITYN